MRLIQIALFLFLIVSCSNSKNLTQTRANIDEGVNFSASKVSHKVNMCENWVSKVGSDAMTCTQFAPKLEGEWFILINTTILSESDTAIDFDYSNFHLIDEKGEKKPLYTLFSFGVGKTEVNLNKNGIKDRTLVFRYTSGKYPDKIYYENSVIPINYQ